jgi:predicted PurR-regulated permease PerM
MKQIAVITALVLTTLFVLWVLVELRVAVLIFFLSLSTSAALRPAIEWLMARRWPKVAALLVTYFALLVAFVGILVALVFPTTTEVQQFATDFRDAYHHMTDSWPQGSPLEQAVALRLPTLDDVETLVLHTDSETIKAVVGVTWSFLGALLHIVIIVVLSLYWSIDRIHFERLWLSLLAVEYRQRARETWRAVEHATGAYLQREAGQSLSAGLLLGVGFYVIGQPYPVLSAVIGALMWLIPYVGAFLAMMSVMAISMPAVILAGREHGPLLLLAAAIYTLLVLLLLELIVEPRLFRSRRYNPILLLLVAVGMFDWLGLLGLLIAPPVAATVQIVGGLFLEKRSSAVGTVSHPAQSPQLTQRLAALKAKLSDIKNPSAEIQDLVHRLDNLMEKSRQVLRENS